MFRKFSVCSRIGAVAAVLAGSVLAGSIGANAGDTRVAAIGAGAPEAMVPGVPANPDYKLGTGDRVRISVFGERDLTDIYQLDGQGKIAFPLVGEIQASGLNPKELERKVATVLSPEYVKHPHVSVEVLTYRPFYIMGEVNKPGNYPYASGLTVITAAALAGGFTYRADEDDFDLTRIDKSGHKDKIKAKPDTPVQPGDIIGVSERIF